jgi:hypothetical protein
MKSAVMVLAFALTIGGAGSSMAQIIQITPEKPKIVPGKPPLALSITGPGTVKSGSKVAIQIVMTNVSGRVLMFNGESSAEELYEATVRDAHGNMAPDTEHGRKRREKMKENEGLIPNYSGHGFALKSGETGKYELVISDQYDMSQPGKYSVQVTGWGAKSNTVPVTVTP